MGQKVHPGGLRVGVIHDWKSNWYSGKKEFAGVLLEDVKIREHINASSSHAGLSDILIRKDKQRITIDIYTARPGIVIGKSGVEVDALRKEVHAITQKNVHININEIKRPELDAKLVAQSIAEQLQNRVSFRRAMKRSLASAMRSGAQGIKIQCGGRLGGGEMSRSERYSEGRVPLHTIRADIDYGFAEAKTTYGRIGVKVWINKGEIMPEGFEGMTTGKDTRLGDQDQARRRRGGAAEGLGASRESGRGRAPGPRGPRPRQSRRRPGGRPGGGARAVAAASGGPAAARRRPAARAEPAAAAEPQDNVERPRTDEQGVSAEGREQPVDRAAGRDDAGAGRRRARHDDAEDADRGPDEARRVRRRRARCCSRRRPSSARVHRGRRRGDSRRARPRCSSATTGSRRSRPAGSRTARSRRPGSR